MQDNSNDKKFGAPVALLIAIIGCVGTCIAAMLTSPIIVRIFDLVIPVQETPAPAVEGIVTSPPAGLQTPALNLSIEIVGPDTAPVGKRTYYTLLSQNASRAEWSIGGFSSNETFVIDPLSPSQQIYVQPSDVERIGDVFIISVTAYNDTGESVTATKQFTVVSD